MGVEERLSIQGKPLQEVIPLLTEISDQLVRQVQDEILTPWTREMYIDERRGRVTESRIQLLEKASDTLELEPIMNRDAIVDVFIKSEFLLKPGVPRIIMPTSDRYLVELGRYIGPVEKLLNTLEMFYEHTTKGLTYLGMGRVFKNLVDKCAEPVAYSIDFSKFDAHVSKELMEIEHSVYKRLLPDPYFNRLLAMQYTMKGKTTFGKFIRTAGRASGCPNTTLGNTLINIFVHEAIKRSRQVTSANYICIGDDALVITEVNDREWPEDAYKDYGLKVKLIKTTIAMAEYCSGNFMPIGDNNFTFVRTFNRMLRKLPKTILNLSKDEAAKMWHDKLHADLSLMPKVPLLSMLLYVNHANTKCSKLELTNLSWIRRVIVDVTTLPEQIVIDPVSREWFYEVYGLSPYEQIAAESEIARTGWTSWLTEISADETTAEELTIFTGAEPGVC